MLHYLTIFFIFFFLFPVLPAKSETLAFRSDYYCPYICDPQSANPGYMVEILKKVFTKAGFKIDIKITNWARSIKEARTNRVQGLIATSKGDAPDLIYPLQPLGKMKAAFYIPKNSAWSFDDSYSFINARIGVVNAYWYGERLDQVLKSGHKSFFPFSGSKPLEKILKMIFSRRLDGFIENEVILHYTLSEKKIPKTELQRVRWIEIEDPYLFVAFSPKNPKSQVYAEILSKGVEKLRRSGELRQILKKYHLKDWQTSEP